MDKGQSDNRKRSGSVRTAINMFGGRIHDDKPAMKKPQANFSEKSNSRTRELHQARRDISRYNENRKMAESAKAEAESELYVAKKTVKDLTEMIEESSLKAKAKMRDLEKLKQRDEEWALAVGNIDNYQYAEVMRELEYVKQELSKLKLEMASVLEEKVKAEKEIEASNSKMGAYSSSAEAIRKEIQEANEEQVLVELARIEARKEFEAVVEAQREEEESRYSAQLEETRKKMKDIIQELDRAKEMETNLAVTMHDVDVLQGELKQVKEMDSKIQRHKSSIQQEEEEEEYSSMLKSVSEELEVAKNELASVKEEGFQFMASMDVIRDELKHVREEMAQLRKTEERADLTVQNLNSKLLRAKSKLESISSAEEKATTMLTNLSLTLEQMKTEKEAAKKQKELISEETTTIKAEVQKTESEIDLAEEKLRAAMLELERIKSSEAMALEKLQVLTENTMRARASASQHSSSITISNFEYEYLSGRAVGAEAIADKKVAAAQAWTEALKSGEKEILMKIELAQREIRGLVLEEEKEVSKTEKSLSAKIMVEGQLRNQRQRSKKNGEAEELQLAVGFPRKSTKGNGNLTPVRRPRPRKSASPAIRASPRSTPFNLSKRKKVMPNIAKIFGAKRIHKG